MKSLVPVPLRSTPSDPHRRLCNRSQQAIGSSRGKNYFRALQVKMKGQTQVKSDVKMNLLTVFKSGL